MAGEHMTTSLIQDAQARQEALEINSFIVEAPAGAGKMELQTQRFLRLLETIDGVVWEAFLTSGDSTIYGPDVHQQGLHGNAGPHPWEP